MATPGPMLTAAPQTFVEALQSLGLQEVVTSAINNCLDMAVVQGVTGKDLKEPTLKMEQLTTTFKTGIKEVGLLNLEDNIPHYIRQQILPNVHRAWPYTTRRESLGQLKWSFEDYASTSIKREAVIAHFTLGRKMTS